MLACRRRRLGRRAPGRGAVNTLLRAGAGWSGFNTDGYGARRRGPILPGAGLAGNPVVLLGAGGAARGAAFECVRRGCARIWVCQPDAARTWTRSLADLRALSAHGARSGHRPEPPRPASGRARHQRDQRRAPRTDPRPARPGRCPARPRVFDMIYNPPRHRAPPAGRDARGSRRQRPLDARPPGGRALEIWTGVPAAADRPGDAGGAGGDGGSSSPLDPASGSSAMSPDSLTQCRRRPLALPGRRVRRRRLRRQLPQRRHLPRYRPANRSSRQAPIAPAGRRSPGTGQRPDPLLAHSARPGPLLRPAASRSAIPGRRAR